MGQSTFSARASRPPHLAIIMDGNGRWASRRGLPREAGHRAGAVAVRRVVEAAPPLGIGTLTLFAFSADNWHRPKREVVNLMQVYEDFFRAEKETWGAQGIRLNVIGRRDRLPAGLRAAIEEAEAATAHGRAMDLRIALDYSGRDAILRAAQRYRESPSATPESFARLLGEVNHAGDAVPDVDLIIRTGGEQRLSDFMLWESAYAELYFTPCLWPDFTGEDLAAATREFQSRERRFGRIPEVVAG